MFLHSVCKKIVRISGEKHKKQERKPKSMSDKTLPFDKSKIEEIAASYPTPFHIYDEAGLRSTAQNLKKAFSWSKDYINYFAVKATPNPYIMEILKEEGMGADASSLPELILSDKVESHPAGPPPRDRAARPFWPSGRCSRHGRSAPLPRA